MILLQDNGRYVERQIESYAGAFPQISEIASKVLDQWARINYNKAFGGRLLAALRDEIVDAADIACEFAQQLVPGQSKFFRESSHENKRLEESFH